jgi:hypothetical protein
VKAIESRLRKLWYISRRRRKRHAPRAVRPVITKTAWPGAADSPVVLMIDDLTNAWHNRNGADTWEHGGDWGGGLDSPTGAVAFLEDRLLREFPEARATFFVVAGGISAYTHHQPFGYAAPLDATEASRRFFSALDKDPRYELAYHGYNHGTAGERTETFLQEWRGFPSREAALEQTRRGLEIFRRATGRIPRGGKYGGWDYNHLADDAVSELGFRWWCRDWMPRDVTGSVAAEYYEAQFFGSNLVVALPSTVHGQFWDPQQIKTLLATRQIIAIEEHIAPVRPDGLVQTPNIVDDIEELRRLYRHLRSRNVWHANCSDIAAYVAAREQTLVYDVTAEGFALRYTGQAERPALTLRVDCSMLCSAERPLIAVTLPDGQPLEAGAYRFDPRRYRHLVTLPVVEGRYRLAPCTN